MQMRKTANQTSVHVRTTVQSERNSLDSFFTRFPSLRFFYGCDPQTLLNTVNSLAVMRHLIDGAKEDYEALTRLQSGDRLSYFSFLKFSEFMEIYKYHPEQRRQLELFIYLDGICRTEKGKKLTANLPASVRNLDRDSLALAIVNHELLAETREPGFANMICLRHAFAYRREAVNGKVGPVTHADGEAMRVVHTSVLCDIAGLAADEDNLGASVTLTEGMACNLLTLISQRHIPQVAMELCSLTAS